MVDDPAEPGDRAPEVGAVPPNDPAAVDLQRMYPRVRSSPRVAVMVLVLLALGVAGGIVYLSTGGDDSTTPGGSEASEVPVAPVAEGMSFAAGTGPIVDVYVDYQCDHCAELDQVIGAELVRLTAAGEVELVIRPVRFVNRASSRGAAALYCAADGGQAFAMHQELLADIGGDFTLEGLTSLAGRIGLDEPAFETCLTAEETAMWVNGVTEQARSEGIEGIPAVFVDGTRLSDAELATERSFREAVLTPRS